ncbi:Ig-like domain-containing protein [Pyxidicoccus trucidator]|uniref:Ig-like domain-containing protein n=1 Tax=Pyxidicoccus trucidator TaxID=2709662 RepID=UPI0013D92C46|nr:Ig-like domain-containing protein [Pyxidicoccus trucidator]
MESDPIPKPVKEEPPPPPPELTVTVETAGPEFCRQGTWTLSVSVTGGMPERVELIRNGRNVTSLVSPYRHTVDCATHDEGSFSFVARAVAEGLSFDSPSTLVVVDRGSPRVESWRPDTYYPSVDTQVEIVFSEPLQPESLQAAPTLLRDGNGFSVVHQTVLSEDGRVLRLVPTLPLRPPVTLHAELLQRSMTDRAGNPFQVGTGSTGSEREFSYWPFAQVGPRLSKSVTGPISFALETFPQERPVALYVEQETQDSPGKLAVARWRGDAWERLPPPLEFAARSPYPSNRMIQVSKAGAVVIAWAQTNDDTDTDWIHVMRYDGTSWTLLGAPRDTQSRITYSQMALDSDGHPVLVYEERNLDLRVVRWTGTAWEALGGPISGNPQIPTFASYPAIAVDSSEVVLAWSEVPPEATRDHVFVMRFKDGRWSRLGGLLRGTAGGGTDRVAIALRRNGDPVVAWTEWDANYDDGFVFVSQWKLTSAGEGWAPPELLLQGMTRSAGLEPPFIVIHDDEPWVSWQRRAGGTGYASYFRRHRDSSWEPEQLIAGTELYGFRVDEKGFPWVAVEGAILRPQ